MSGELYEHYVEFKNWSAAPTSGNASAFANLVEASGKRGHLNLLEIGFGDGAFMDWARSAGHKVTGLELIPALVQAVRDRGHQAYLANEGPPNDVKYDAVIAFDVLEHLDFSQFREIFGLAERALDSGGVIVGRFPNGDSPFFGRYQYGDYTHAKPLSWRAVNQLAIPNGFEVTKALNPRPLPRSFLARLKHRLVYLVRNLVEAMIGFAYFGYRTPMDPNIIVVLSRRATRPGPADL